MPRFGGALTLRTWAEKEGRCAPGERLPVQDDVIPTADRISYAVTEIYLKHHILSPRYIIWQPSATLKRISTSFE